MRRREFLKAGALAAGVSLLEACSRREVEYLRQPVERSLQPPGTAVWQPGVCQECPAGCGVQVRIIDGNAKKVEGNPHHPVNRGGLCALGQASLQGLYNPDRILTPLKRSGPRGRGDFEETSWEEALRRVAESLAGRVDDDGRLPPSRPEVALVVGTPGGFLGALWRRFAAALGAPAPAVLQAPEVEVERVGAQMALGVPDLPFYDLAHSDYAISVGAAFLDRWRSPVHYARALTEMRQGRPGRRGKLVAVESRMSLTAAKADEWLPVLPGTEGTLARALASVILEEGWAPSDRAAGYRVLYPEDGPALESAEEAARVCRLPAAKIRRIARELSRAERSVVMAGGSAAGHTNGLANVVAALGLNLLLGSLGRPGGVFAPASFRLEEGLEPADPAGTGGTGGMAELASRLSGARGPGVEVLLVSEADPVYHLPPAWGLQDGLSRVETVITLSSFYDDTTLMADLVLPVHTPLERFDAVEPASSVGVPVLGLARPVVEPVGQSRHPGDVLLALARVLGGPVAEELPWAGYAALAESRIGEELARLPGGGAPSPRRFRRYYERAMAQGGIWEEGSPRGLPRGPAAPAPEPGNPESHGNAESYPFVLVPFESVKTGDGRGANRPWLQELPDPLSTVMWDSWLEISPEDAERLGIRTGDRVEVESPSGSVEVGAVVLPATRPGLVALPLGQGHRGFGRYAKGRGANPMGLVGELVVEGTSAPAWAATRVRLRRLGKGSLAVYGRGLRQAEEIPRGWRPQAPVSSGER